MCCIEDVEMILLTRVECMKRGFVQNCSSGISMIFRVKTCTDIFIGDSDNIDEWNKD